jgi:beta-xylosidase
MKTRWLLLFCSIAITGIAQEVPDSVMQKIYNEIKTPYKYGLVVSPSSSTKKVDCPTVFKKDNRWYMSYIEFDGTGYETLLAESTDLLHWKTLGTLLSRSNDSTKWDAYQRADLYRR